MARPRTDPTPAPTRPPPSHPPPPARPVATPMQTAACALAFRAYVAGLVSARAAEDTFADVFAHPDRAEAIAAFYRGKFGAQRPPPPGPTRLGDLLRGGPAVDPDVRAQLNRPTVAPEVTHAEP